jgi:hypothetical protein
LNWQNLNESELRVLFRKTLAELVRTDEGSADRRNALAKLENISASLRQRGHRWHRP